MWTSSARSAETLAMAEEPPGLTTRIAPFQLPERYDLPSRPPATAGADVLDTYRQAQFLLATDIALFEEAMNLQIRIFADSRPGKYRTHAVAGLAALWARTYHYLADSWSLLVRGSYVSALPLVRAACEGIAAQYQLGNEGMPELTRRLAGGIRQNRQHIALEFALDGPETLDLANVPEELGALQRVVSRLCQPILSTTAVQLASDSNPARLSIFFAEHSFHLAWAELVAGWLMTAAATQVAVDIALSPPLVVSDGRRAEYVQLWRNIQDALTNPRRCRAQEITNAEGQRRYLLHNFRRLAGSDPRRILL